MLLTQTLKADDNTGENINSPVSSHDDLPAWFFEGGVIGISDPSSDTLRAFNQALMRALTLYALNQNAEMSSVYEYYYLDDNVKNITKNQKSHWIAEIYSNQENFSYEVEKIFHTKYKETIVLLNMWHDSSSNNKLIVEGFFMYHYDCLNDKVVYGEKQQFVTSFSSMNDAIEWNSTVDNNVVNKMSIVGDEEVKLKNMLMIYNDKGQVTDEMPFAENYYGLWDCFIDTFFQSLSNLEYDKLIVKNTSRYVTQENNGVFEDKLQNIVRSVIKVNVSSKLNFLSLKNNKLYAKWEMSE